MPSRQTFLPEFEAFCSLNRYMTVIITDSSDITSRLGNRCTFINGKSWEIPTGPLLNYRFSFLTHLKEIIRSIKPVAIFTFEIYSTYSFQVSQLKKVYDFSHFVVCYDTIPKGSSMWGLLPLTRFFAHRVGRQSDVFIALSQTIKDSLLKSGIRGDKIVMKYPPVPVPPPGKHTADAINGRSIFRILFLGRLRENKGLGTLLSAFRSLDSSLQPGLRLSIAGSGPLESIVVDATRTQSNVDFIGFVDGERKWIELLSSDLFVYPSEDILSLFGTKRWEEQTAAAVREAMSAGLPVIVSDSGSLPELVGRHDVVFHQGDVTGLREKIIHVYSSGELQRELSSFNQDRSRRLFGMDAFSQFIENLVDDHFRNIG